MTGEERLEVEIIGYKDTIKKLLEQIEKMKNCANCTHRHYWGNELGCNLELEKSYECERERKYWEFRE